MSADVFKTYGTKPVIRKDPNSRLDYTIDFSDWLLPVADTIASASAVTTGGLVVEEVVTTDTTVVVWVSGGDITVDDDYASVTVRIITRANSPLPRIDDRTIFFNVVEK